ncbi:MAG: Dos2-interacting transcription regulator of RNA-Pol-II-domain-containing protein [Benjaminiella poitrasii]|nr:MAG: Dos2-interacting transcription regulator of RNA-Pol-II-domain-containing protein [Benjaminiella poitrasii]
MEKHVTDFMITKDENEEEASKKVVELINNDKDVKSNLLYLIQVLGEYLVHENDSIRSKAISLLSYVMNHCEQTQLNESSVSVLVSFYCSRLSDTSSVPNLMTGLNALTHRFDQFKTECTKIVVQSLNHDIFVQTFPHITRNTTFKVFQNLLDYHLDDLKQGLENDFISGFLRSTTGEKDPRNLMTVYSTIQKIIKSLDITHHTEDLFDATFCYFPITFRPPPDNPYGITAKDLKLNLRKCMAATPLFSTYALPLLLQKLSITSGSAKKDALETLSACTTVYPVEELLEIGTRLYDAIKVEIINGDPDPGLREPSLNAITALTKAMTTYHDQEAVIKVLKVLVDDCLSLLDELDEDHVKPASLVLRAAASASPYAYDLIENAILPLLLRQYREHDDMVERYLILCTMVAMIQAKKIVYGSVNSVSNDDLGDHHLMLDTYKERLTDMFSTAITKSKENPDVQLMGILGLGLLCVLKSYLTKDERANCIKTLSSVLETEEEERLRMSVEMSLIEIAAFDPSLIIQITLPTLVQLLPDFSSSSMEEDAIPYKLTLTTLQKLCISSTIYESIEQDLLAKFLYICSHNKDRRYALQVISTLLSMIQARVKDEKEQIQEIKKCTETLLSKLLMAVTSAVLNRSEAETMIILSGKILENINLIFLTVFSNLNSEEQKEFIALILKYFKTTDLTDLGLRATSDFHPLLSCASEPQAACTQLFATVISACRKDVASPTEDPSAPVNNSTYTSFVNQVLEEALKSTRQAQIVSFSRMIASVLNKRKNDDDLEKYLNELKDRLEDLVQAKLSSALTIYVWITKALILRNHKIGFEMTDSIISWIPDPVVGKQASTSFDTLIGDDTLSLNKTCFATISFLYKQKFMTYSFPKLLEKFNSVTEDEKMNYLVAVAYLFKNVPKSILIDQLPLVVPLLIESLSLPDNVILKLSTLDLFQFALNEATETMATYIITLLPAFISLIDLSRSPMKVRISALKCIELVATKISRDVVLPYVKDTLKAVAMALDDRKRLVRLQAVECRESWYLLGHV